MHGLPDLQSTPVSNSSVRSTPTVDLNTNIFEYSFLSDSDAGEWFRNCSFCGDSAISTLSRFDLTCRHSPRLLANGYYVLDEDSILSNEEGNLTLSPTKTNVTYKERLVRIFRRKKKKFCKSLASIFAMNLDNSVVDSSAISDMVTHDCDLDDKEDSDAENERNIDPDPQNSKSLLLETPAPFLTPSAVKEHVGPKVQEPPVLGKKTGRGASCPRIAERTAGHSTSFEKEHRSDQRPEHLRRRVSYGGFLMVNGDNCEFSHGQGRWTSRNRRLVFNATRSPRHLAVLSPIKARLALSPKVHNAMPGYFCERNLRDFEINIARSPIYLIVMILVCIVISTWGI